MTEPIPIGAMLDANRVDVHVRMPQVMRDRIREIEVAEHRKPSSVIRLLLFEAINARANAR